MSRTASPWNPQHLFGGGIDRGYDFLLIDGDDSGCHIFQDDLHILFPLFQLETAHLEISGHLIEGLDEHPNLIGRLHGDSKIEISGGNSVRRLCQLLNGNRDVLGQVEAEPGR